MKVIKASMFLLIISIFLISSVYADVLFSDNFETGSLDAGKWSAPAAWQVIDNADGLAVLGNFVLDVLGGEEALSVMEFPENFDYYANFKSVNGLTGFIFHAQDTNNLYMNQVSVTGSAWTPNNIRWHTKIGGNYAAFPQPFIDEVDREMGVWYRVKFEVRGANLKVYLGDANASMIDMSLVGDWTPDNEPLKSGKIGIRMSGSEHAVYDNIKVMAPGADPDGDLTAVERNGKLSQTWGTLKK